MSFVPFSVRDTHEAMLAKKDTVSGIRRNLLSSIYLAGANSLSQLALVPVFLHCWGQQVYGEWLVLFTVPAFFVFSDVGLSSAVGNALTIALGQGRVREAERSFNAAWKFQVIAWVGIFCVLGLLLIFSPLREGLGVPQMDLGKFSLTVLMLSLYSLASLQASMLSAIYRAAGTYANYLSWSAHARILEAVLVAVVLASGGRIIAVAAAMLAVRAFGTVILYEKGRRLLPGVCCRLFSGTWADLVPLLPSGLAFLSFPVANALVNQGTVLVVNHMAGPAAVVLLNVCRQLARIFQQGTSTILTAFQPEMTRAYGAKNGVRVRQLQSAALLPVCLVAIPFIAGVTVFGADVIQGWTRKDLGVTWPLMFACSVEAVTFGGGALCSLLPWAINRIRALSLVYILLNAGALLGGAVLMGPFGLTGLVGAFCLAGTAYCATGLFLGCRLGGFALRDLWSPREIAATVAWWRTRKA